MAPPVYSVGQVWGAADVNVWALPSAVIKPSAEHRTSTIAVTNDAALVLPVAANAVYRFELFLLYSGNTLNAGDLRSSLTFPASSVLAWQALGVNTAGNVLAGGGFTDASGNLLFGTAGAGVFQSCTQWGTINTAGTAGNLQFKWGQVTSSATDTIVYTNSTLSMQRIG